MKASTDLNPPRRRAAPARTPSHQPSSPTAFWQALGRARDGEWAPAFLAAHWTPVLLLALSAVLLATLGGDQWLADRIYAWQGNHWGLRSAFVTETLIHVVGRNLSAAAWLGVLAAWVVARHRPRLSSWRTPLATLLVSTLLASAVVAWIKSWSNMDCPWDLARYGGAREYVGLLSLRPVGMPRAVCFPAGHASAGYSWLALYFFFLVVRPQWRWLGLAVGISLGLLFGLVQQMRGAHFLSHDLWTAAICWACALGGYLFFQRKSRLGATADIPAPPGPADLARREPATWQSTAGAR